MLKSLHTKQNDAFLALLRDIRQDVRLRQADLADRLGRDQATVSKVERGERRLDVIELRVWLSALEIDFVTFMRKLDERLAPLSNAHAVLNDRSAVTWRTRRDNDPDRSEN